MTASMQEGPSHTNPQTPSPPQHGRLAGIPHVDSTPRTVLQLPTASTFCFWQKLVVVQQLLALVQPEEPCAMHCTGKGATGRRATMSAQGHFNLPFAFTPPGHGA